MENLKQAHKYQRVIDLIDHIPGTDDLKSAFGEYVEVIAQKMDLMESDNKTLASAYKSLDTSYKNLETVYEDMCKSYRDTKEQNKELMETLEKILRSTVKSAHDQDGSWTAIKSTAIDKARAAIARATNQNEQPKTPGIENLEFNPIEITPKYITATQLEPIPGCKNCGRPDCTGDCEPL